jgi:hypothetical protein
MSDRQEQLRTKIRTLEQAAFELAVARWQYGAPLPETDLANARLLQAELRELVAEVRQHYPKLHASLSDMVSEAMLDFKYAINAPPATSLRLHHYIESQSQTGG